MGEEQRQYKRIEKRITILFSLTDVLPKKWDISFVENISVGGVKFIASGDLKLSDKVLHLQIKIPELSPRILEIDAQVLSANPRMNGKTYEVRAKFINLTDKNKEDLSVIEKSINWHQIIDANRSNDKKK